MAAWPSRWVLVTAVSVSPVRAFVSHLACQPCLLGRLFVCSYYSVTSFTLLSSCHLTCCQQSSIHFLFFWLHGTLFGVSFPLPHFEPMGSRSFELIFPCRTMTRRLNIIGSLIHRLNLMGSRKR